MAQRSPAPANTTHTYPYPPTQPILPKIKPNHQKPKDVIDHQKKQQELTASIQKRYPLPDMRVYKPFPVDYDTFGKSLQLVYDKVKPEGNKIKYWVSSQPQPLGQPPRPQEETGKEQE